MTATHRRRRPHPRRVEVLHNGRWINGWLEALPTSHVCIWSVAVVESDRLVSDEVGVGVFPGKLRWQIQESAVVVHRCE
jgi:hypothetical protein